MSNPYLAPTSSLPAPADWRTWSPHQWSTVSEADVMRLPCGPESTDNVDSMGRHVLMAALAGGCSPRHLRKLFFMSLAWEPFVDLMAREDSAGVRLMAYLVRYLPEDPSIDGGCWVLFRRHIERLPLFPVINSHSQGLLHQLYVLALREQDMWNWFPQGDWTVSFLSLQPGQWQAGLSETLINRFAANGVLAHKDTRALASSLYGVSRTLTRTCYFDRESGRICLWRPSVERLVRVCEWTRLLVASVDLDRLESFLDTDRNLIETFEDLKPDLCTLWHHMEQPQNHIVRAVMLERRHHMRWALFVKSLPPHPRLHVRLQ